MFEERVKVIDRNFGAQKRKITVIIDNSLVHPDVQAFDWVELIFLPPNTTSISQPMNQGIIRSLKAKYRSLTVRKQIDALEKGNQLPKFSILSAMPMLTKALNSIPEITFTNCLKKSVTSENQWKSLEMMRLILSLI